MKCSQCGYPRTIVYDTRDQDQRTSVRRRRECTKCGYRFTTTEEELINDKTDRVGQRGIGQLG